MKETRDVAMLTTNLTGLSTMWEIPLCVRGGISESFTKQGRSTLAVGSAIARLGSWAERKADSGLSSIRLSAPWLQRQAV